MYSRKRKRQVNRTVTDRNGNKTTKKEWRYFPTIMWQGQEIGLGSCRTSEDAENAINVAKSNIAKGLHPKAKAQSPMVQELWDEMLNTAKKTGAWRASTILTYESTYNLDIKKEFGKKRLSDVSRSDVQRWVNKLCAKKNNKGRNIAPASVDRPYRLLRHIFNQAVDNDYIPKNPCIRIKKPSQNKRNIDCLTLEEIESVLEKMDYQQQVFFSVLAFAGLRTGECLGLKRSNIDLGRGTINVTHSWSRANGYSPPKTAAAVRSVPMVDEVRELLEDYCGNGNFEADDFLFVSPRTGFPPTVPYRSHLNKALKATSVRHVTPYSFRHSFATLMIAAGASIIALSKAMGHASTQMTLDIYGHLYPQELENSIDKANDFIRTKWHNHEGASQP